MYKTIETDRLTIRPIALTDAAFIIELVNTPGWIEFIGDKKISDRTGAEKYIQKILNNHDYYYCVFELKSNAQPIGLVTFLNREKYDHPDIGFAILPDYMRNGYAFEASRRYLEEIVESKKHENIIGITIPGNVKSIRLLEKLGLKYAHNKMDDGEDLAVYMLYPR